MKPTVLKNLILFSGICLFVFSALQVDAQNQRGRVIDEAGIPLADVYIANLRSGTHAHSNEAGYFSLGNTNRGDALQVRLLSFEPAMIVAPGDTSALNVRLSRSSLQLSEVVVRSGIAHLNMVSGIDTRINPVNTSQELLRRVPGLFIGQHAGGGKAEQIFLRGFDIDHGTDIAISVDGMPVNMVSHAHGQGYADLHFLIPETVDQIDFDKGPYHADKGNLATAGYVAFETKDRLQQSSVTVEAGKFNTLRTVALFNVLNTEKQSAYLATEYLNTDGYFQASQNFHRLNLFGKYSGMLSERDRLSLSISHLGSKWNASGQIPERAVAAGLISRWGSIDSTEGGTTQRTNIILQHQRFINPSTSVTNHAYYTRYGFQLYSNFTFFLNDPVNGDQIRQREVRDLAGFGSAVTKQIFWGRTVVDWKSGAGLRYDRTSNSELSHTLNRETVLDALKLGDISEANLHAYSGVEIRLGKWMINPALRADYFVFDYTDKLAPAFQNPSARKAIISPKLNVLYTQHENLQYFIKLGKGFHSNDTRVVTAATGKAILPAAYGADAGLSWKPFRQVVFNAALWYLHLQQEFVYVGDEGVVEPGGKTERKGIDLGLRWQWGRHIFLAGDFTYSWARALGEPKGADYIPLAPRATVAASLNFKTPAHFAGSIKARYLDNRPANEDYSLIAQGYFITDCNLNYSYKNITVGLIAENLFNADWKETQFATESRLQNEPQPVTEIHFTPGTPFNIRGVVTFRF
jgi:hypothetical protein